MAIKTPPSSGIVSTDPIGKNQYNEVVADVQALLTVTGKAFDPRWTDGKYNFRTNAGAAQFLDEQGSKVPEKNKKAFDALKSAFKPNVNGNMTAPVDSEWLRMFRQYIIDRLKDKDDLAFKMTARENATGILEKEDKVGGFTNDPKVDAKIHDLDDIKAAQRFANILGYTDASGSALKVDGVIGDKTHEAMQKMRAEQARDENTIDTTAKKSAAPVVDASAQNKDAEITKLKEENARLAGERDAARDGEQGLQRKLERQTELTNQFHKAADEFDPWKATLKSADFLHADKSDPKLVLQYCNLFVASCLTKEEKLRGVMFMNAEGHIIYMRANPEIKPGTQKEHEILAYDITRQINDTRQCSDGSLEPVLKGLETVRFVPANIGQVDQALQLSHAYANTHNQQFDPKVGVLLQMKGDIVHRRDAHYYLQGVDTDNDGHVDRVSLVSQATYDANKAVYEHAANQTPDAIKWNATQRGLQERETLGAFNDVQTWITVDPRFSTWDQVECAVAGNMAASASGSHGPAVNTGANGSGESGGGYKPVSMPTATHTKPT